jgi:adenine deaminase
MSVLESVTGNFIDIPQRKIYPAEVRIEDGIITEILPVDEPVDTYLLPGFVDAHIHIESSMLVPYEFAKVAVQHGTVATISDPHEIANVCGIPGVEYMLENARGAGLKFHFGAPSCVPATAFETSGAELGVGEATQLLERPDIHFLSEMMNYPGVLARDAMVMGKIQAAHELGKPVDGHAPGLRGQQAAKYISAGISTDHECFTLAEAQEKLQHGMKILIREGSAAKNYEALHPIIASHPDEVMLCSDDKHPDDLMLGHINQLVLRSLDLGYDLFDVLRIACINPVHHYNMNVGLLRVGDPADFIRVKDTESFDVLETVIDGTRVFVAGEESFFEEREHPLINNFHAHEVKPPFTIQAPQAPIIRALNGELITEKADTLEPGESAQKIVVVNRYKENKPAASMITGFDLQQGAMASSVTHDSHNLIAVGADDTSIARALNLLMDQGGGLSVVLANGEAYQEMVLPLAVGGLMSASAGEEVARAYEKLDHFAKERLGTKLTAPFMTLSFMALLVIPKIKISDLGLFDAEAFTFY